MKVHKVDTFAQIENPGDYTTEGNLAIKLPCGDMFIPQGKWEQWNIEDENKITMSPSIFCTPQLPCWHGFLIDGEFKDA